MSLHLLLSRTADQRFGPRIHAALEGIDHRIVHVDDLRPGTPVDVALLTRDITGKSTKSTLAASAQRFFEVVGASPRLRWLHIHSAGNDRPQFAPLLARGVTITTSSGASANTLAVSVLGGMIALAREFPAQWDAQRRHAWEPLDEVTGPPEFGGRTALVVGLGPIGREISRLLRAFRLHVIGVRNSAGAVEECDETITYEGLDAALPRADWLILACPLTPKTRGLVDARALALLPAGARVVNVARGEVAVEPDLVGALASGKLAGAWLDVFTTEPLDPASALWDMPHVLVSPHCSSRSSGHYDIVGDIFVDNLGRFRDGRPLRNVALAPPAFR